MTTPRRRAALAVAVALLLSATLVPGTEAAAPRLMMVYGGELAEPIILGDWNENLEFLLSIYDPISVLESELEGRPYLSLALFWGPEWNAYVDRGGSLAALQPAQANQHGRFYPALGTRQPILILSSVPGPGTFARRADPHAAEVLLRHGIPAGPIAVPVGAGFGLGALAALPIRIRP